MRRLRFVTRSDPRERRVSLGLLLAAATMIAGLAVSAAAWAQLPESTDRGGEARTMAAPELVGEDDLGFQSWAVRVQAGPAVDGLLDDLAWRDAVPISGFVQSQPNEGDAATERTEVRIVYDGSTIFIGATLYDREPDAIIAAGLRRDEQLDADDHLVVTLDTYHDHRNGYLFQTNANGAKFDAQIIGEGGASRFGGGATFNESWDTVWYAAARVTSEGWVAEIAIPFHSLRFHPERMEAWGLNVRRGIPRRSELDYWAPVPRQYDATRLSQSGVLLGLERVASPRNLQVKPFIVGDVATVPTATDLAGFPTRHSTEGSGDAGLDAKWAFTPNMTLDVTANTDFSQVEADDVQINLTRFPLFFPEKREFFLENGGLFHFGSGEFGRTRMMGVGVLGFHSRRIGIFAGEEVPLLGGGRVSGKLGPWAIGALTMQSRNTDVLDSSNYGVVRVRRELGDRSNLGILFTNRQTSGNDYNRAFGVDGR